MQLSRIIRVAGKSIGDNSPAILSGIAVAGVVGTVVLAVKATPKAIGQINIVNDINADLVDNPRDMSLKDKVQITWKVYIPAAITGVATIACIVGANHIGARRNAALLGAYTLVDTAFREYKDEVVKQIGAVKEQKIKDEVVKRDIDAHPVNDAQVIITGGGDQLCYETLSGRYFKSDAETIRRCANDLNARIFNDLYASLNEFWELLGLGSTTLGDELGFNIEHTVQIVFTSHLASDNRPCLALGYTHIPIKDYSKL